MENRIGIEPRQAVPSRAKLRQDHARSNSTLVDKNVLGSLESTQISFVKIEYNVHFML